MTKTKQKSSKNPENKEEISQESSSFTISWAKCILLLILFIAISCVHRQHLANMFERDRHFSHLSDLEREMTFRTEMGFYFSFYKQLVRANDYNQELVNIIQDNITEYGHTINTLQRFNLYPELFLSACFRSYKKVANYFKWKIVECWKTNRGEGLEPIISCEGSGNAYYFYVNAVFAFAGSLAGILFLHGYLLSESLLGGLLTVAAFFFNHGEATRVQWTPPLRESFGYPVFALQLLVTTLILKTNTWNIFVKILYVGFTCTFLLVWQFSAFALATQIACLICLKSFDLISLKSFRAFINFSTIAFCLAFLLLFGNRMLIASLYFSLLIAAQIQIFVEKMFTFSIRFRPLSGILKLICFGCLFIGANRLIKFLANTSDDSHIFDILLSKFTDHATFHTKLYTCAPEFGFIQPETLIKLSLSLLLPCSFIVIILAIIRFFKINWNFIWWKSDSETRQYLYPEILYAIIQLGAFTIMAVLIMRLKLFWTPHLCIIVSLLSSRKLCFNLGRGLVRPLWQDAFCVLILAGMAVQGWANLQQQFSILGEYSNIPQEQLFEWINKNTKPDDVFAGPMPVMGNLKLSTGRPIINHPHYEDVGIRNRTMQVYSIYSRKSAEEVYDIIKGLGVTHFVFDYSWCRSHATDDCSLPIAWDLVDPENRGKYPLCDRLYENRYLGPFREIVFENNLYSVYRIS